MQEVLEFYRIENPLDAKGIFNSRNNNDESFLDMHSQRYFIIQRHSNYEIFPSYNRDETLRIYFNKNLDKKFIDYLFAFNSKSDLDFAFSIEEIKEFISLGFKVYKIKTDNYVQSQFQAMLEKYSYIDKEDITHLYQ
jgi:hypothetical protein